VTVHLQHTLNSAIHCTGVGVHSNAKVAMTLRPADPDTGIVFRRTDIAPGTVSDVAALHENVVDTSFSTTIGTSDRVRIGTVEHLMAAFAGCALDNVIVELDGPEVPIMDGSAAPFVFLIECAGVIAQDAQRRVIEICKPVAVSDGERSISIVPADRFSLDCVVDFDHPHIGRQSILFDTDRTTFKSELCRARTFCLEEDIEKMHAAGLGLGGSLENAVVVGPNGPLNDGGWRHENECVRHKALDCIGDLYLAGAPILGHVKSVCSGHKMNHHLLQALFDDASAWRITTMDDLTVDMPDAIAASA